jgi:large subunit ribosomal protein L23
MKSPYCIVKSLLRTEKGTELLLPLNKYVFWVDGAANKIEIKRAVEEVYKVKVAGVNTSVKRGKKRRVRYQEGRTPDRKKAFVTLKEGHKIDVT